MSIEFPNLGIHFSHVIRTVYIFSFPVAVYGITMALGILMGLLTATWAAKKTGQNPDDYTNIALLGIVLGLIGARTYYVIFSWDYYSAHPGEILDFRGGGLALYGSLIGAVAAVLIYCRIKRLRVLLVLDTACLGMVTGQIIGRWGNFFNREAFGEYTNGLFAMRLPVDSVRAGEVTELMREHEVTMDGVSYIQVHPTFLYESLWNLGVLAVLIWVTIKGKKKFDGEIFLLYLLLYGAGRFWIEGLRTDQLLIWGTHIAVSQVLAAILAVVSAILIIVMRRVCRKRMDKGENR
ncbi:MAG: prolipoprotein diacylglyceryl transferase [Lachnospiraceae bacterium]|nr:prolipoprotein diacylglyceryl transferase [Lachnospiraceae bacterium]